MRVRLLVALLIGLGALASCSDERPLATTTTTEPLPAGPSYGGSPATVGGLKVPARVQGADVELALGDHFEARFWAGVNLGATIPGRSPGEVAATRADYDRWLPQIAALGAKVIRVYTILRPAFYDAVRAYNLDHPRAPLYVLHGVWIPEDELLRLGDLFAPSVHDGMRSEIADAVAVVHGDADLPVRRGHADGVYRSDISPWLLGWSLGIEWDPHAVKSTDDGNAERTSYAGRYLQTTSGATPTEAWLASMLDHTASLEAARGWSRPLTFTNWVTTDPLLHPAEPLRTEDMVGVDATHLTATGAWPGGFFASYHVYPYYPDFLRFEPRYRSYRTPAGKADPYSGYLRDLRRHHGDQAVMITEFGVPTSIGVAHRGALGRDQGGRGERVAGAQQAAMLDDIANEGFAGAVLFEWMDEWFKLTWNTVEFELPGDRRQLWRNSLTNEEHFGVIAAEAGLHPTAVLDGDDKEWTANASQVIFEGREGLTEVRAVKDAEYLWLRLRFDEEQPWLTEAISLAFDTRPGGNGGLPRQAGVVPEADVVITVGAGEAARIRVAEWTDAASVYFGWSLGYFPVEKGDLNRGSGSWVEPRLMLSRPLTIPSTGAKRRAETAGLGTLRWGSGDPAAAGFDNRNLVVGRGHQLELRVPWALLGFADPSSHQVVVPHLNGTVSTETVGKLGISVVQGTTVTHTNGYGWDEWSRVRWHERRKAGWPILQRAFAETVSRRAP